MTTELAADRDLSRDAIVTGTMIRAVDLCDLILSIAEAQPVNSQHESCHYEPGRSSESSSTQMPGLLSHQALPPTQTLHMHGTVKFVLMLKQLELNLTQAKMCLTFLAPSTLPQLANRLASRSATLQNRINVMVGGICT
jgi:hypothetical protein